MSQDDQQPSRLNHASPTGAKEVIKVAATGNEERASKERRPHGGQEGEEDRSLCWGGWGFFEHMVSPPDTLEEGIKLGGWPVCSWSRS